MSNDVRPMIRKSSAVVTTTAAATPETLYQVSLGGNSSRTCIMRKIMAYNDVGATTLMLGTGLGAAWTQRWPTFRLVNNVENKWIEVEIPEVELNEDITVQTDVLGVEVQVEVDEIGS